MYCVVERVLEPDGSVYVIDQVLFVDALRLCNTNDLNFILLATHLGLVNEIRIHTFHVDNYFIDPGVYYHLCATNWEIVRLILSHYGQQSLEEGGKQTIKVTFDDFLKAAVEAKKANLPYGSILAGIPKYELDIISSYNNPCWMHYGVEEIDEGYSLESELEIDIVHLQREISNLEDF